MTIDLNGAGEQMSFDALPGGTLCKVGFSVKAGGVGADGVLTQSKSSAENKQLVLEGTIISAPHAGRKLFEYWIVEGNQQACEISRAKIRAILNSCRGIDPKATDPQAAAGRVINSYGEIHGMVAAVRLSFEPAKGGYEAKNRVGTVIEPGGLHYAEVMAGQTIMPEQPVQGGQQAPAPGGWQAPGPVPAAVQAPAGAPVQQWAPPAQAQPLAAQGGTPDASQMPGVSSQQPVQQQWAPPAAGQPAPGNPGTQPAPQAQEQASAAPNWAQPQQ